MNRIETTGTLIPLFLLAKDCGALAVPLNGSINGRETTFPNEATFSCDEGFILNGSTARRCQASGTWSGVETSCHGEIARSQDNTTEHNYNPFTYFLFSLEKVESTSKRKTAGDWTNANVWQCGVGKGNSLFFSRFSAFLAPSHDCKKKPAVNKIYWIVSSFFN